MNKVFFLEVSQSTPVVFDAGIIKKVGTFNNRYFMEFYLVPVGGIPCWIYHTTKLICKLQMLDKWSPSGHLMPSDVLPTSPMSVGCQVQSLIIKCFYTNFLIKESKQWDMITTLKWLSTTKIQAFIHSFVMLSCMFERQPWYQTKDQRVIWKDKGVNKAQTDVLWYMKGILISG